MIKRKRDLDLELDILMDRLFRLTSIASTPKKSEIRATHGRTSLENPPPSLGWHMKTKPFQSGSKQEKSVCSNKQNRFKSSNYNPVRLAANGNFERILTTRHSTGMGPSNWHSICRLLTSCRRHLTRRYCRQLSSLGSFDLACFFFPPTEFSRRSSLCAPRNQLNWLSVSGSPGKSQPECQFQSSHDRLKVFSSLFKKTIPSTRVVRSNEYQN